MSMIPMELPSGRTVLVPAFDGASGAPGGGAPGDATDELVFEDVGLGIGYQDLAETAAEIGGLIRAAAARARPSKVTAQVAIGVDAKSGKLASLVVEGNAHAALTVTFEWNLSGQDAP